jgi:hypothetical protein
MNPQDIGRENVNSIKLAQDRVSVAGSCERSNETLGAIKGKEFLDQLKDIHLLKDSCCMY